MAITTIVVGSAGWDQKAITAIDKKKQIKLRCSGPLAWAATQALKQNSATKALTGAEVALTALIIAGIIAAIGLGVVAAVCLYGMHKGYNVKARHIAHAGGGIFNDEIYFRLVPPQ